MVRKSGCVQGRFRKMFPFLLPGCPNHQLSTQVYEQLYHRSFDVSLSCFQRRLNSMRLSCVPWSLRELLPSPTFVPLVASSNKVIYSMLAKNFSSNMFQKLLNIRIGLVARICRSQSLIDDQFRQGRGSIPRFGIVALPFALSWPVS
jgi:hypothetical protein